MLQVAGYRRFVVIHVTRVNLKEILDECSTSVGTATDAADNTSLRKVEENCVGQISEPTAT